MPRLCEVYPGICLTTEEKAQKNLSQGSQRIPKITLFLRNTKQYNHLSYISFKNSPLVQPYNSASDCKCDGCIPGSHSMLSDVSSITKAPSLKVWFQLREQVKTSWSQVREYRGTPLLLQYYLLRYSWPKLTSVMEYCCEGDTNCWFSIVGGISFWPYP
jgi:hypothetical protein